MDAVKLLRPGVVDHYRDCTPSPLTGGECRGEGKIYPGIAQNLVTISPIIGARLTRILQEGGTHIDECRLHATCGLTRHKYSG